MFWINGSSSAVNSPPGTRIREAVSPTNLGDAIGILLYLLGIQI